MKYNDLEQWNLFDEKKAFLIQPEAYQEDTHLVEMIETHMSCVFLTEQHAYKIKKPINLSYLDYSHPMSRFYNAHQEIKLNAMLAPDVYLGVSSLTSNRPHHYNPINHSHHGTPVDWLVKMKRFPQNKTLDMLIRNHEFDLDLLTDASERLMSYYLTTKPIFLHPQEFIEHLKNSIKDHYETLLKPHYELNSIVLQEMKAMLDSKLNYLSDYIAQRVSSGHVKDCHGDLRPEHICLTSPPIFVDRLEFNDRLRIMEPIDELAFLSLECELLGRPDVGQYFISAYQTSLQDTPDEELIYFYKSVKAILRAKLCAWHLDDNRISDPEHWHSKSLRYLEQAQQALTV